jgi:hypothetical protein
MNSTQSLEEVITRLTPEQYDRLLSFAQALAAETSLHDDQAIRTFTESLRQRLRELTRKSEAEQLTKAEHIEYIFLAEQLENADAARLEAAALHSKLNNVPLAEALAQFDAGANGRD